jgi:hypothetical protein
VDLASVAQRFTAPITDLRLRFGFVVCSNNLLKNWASDIGTAPDLMLPQRLEPKSGKKIY